MGTPIALQNSCNAINKEKNLFFSVRKKIKKIRFYFFLGGKRKKKNMQAENKHKKETAKQNRKSLKKKQRKKRIQKYVFIGRVLFCAGFFAIGI